MDNICGVWKAQKNIPFAGSGEGTITISADGVAKGAGVLHILRKDYCIAADTITIKPLGNGRYTATYLGRTLTVIVNSAGTTLSLTINPFRLNIINNPRFNLNIPVQFTRVN